MNVDKFRVTALKKISLQNIEKNILYWLLD